MGREADTENDEDVLELDEEMIADENGDDEADEDEEDGDSDDDEEEGDDDGPAVVAFDDDDEEEPKGDNATIRQMRKQIRDLKRERDEARQSSQPDEIEVGAKPTMADCDYDEDAFEKALDDWKSRKQQAEQVKTKREEADRRAQEDWQRDLSGYEQKKATHAFEDHDDAEDAVKAALNVAQQATIIKAANDPALFIYAVGRSDTKLSELAAINDPIKLAAAVARMEGGIKVRKGKKAPALDKPQKGNAAPSASDKQLERLEKDAARTGDRSKLIAYKKKHDLI